MFLILYLSAGFWASGINAQACNDSADCPSAIPHCRTDIMLCVECLDDTHCGEPRPFCAEGIGFCLGCMVMASLCGPTTPVCLTNGRCAECDGTPGQCRENESCQNNTCLCASGDRCRGDNQMCVAGNDCGCSSGFVFNNDTAECECAPIPECESASDCKNKGEECRDEKCVCPEGLKLFRGCCTKPGRLGGWCLNGRCRGRNVRCNHSTDMCTCKRGCGDPAAVCLRRKRPW